MSRASNDTRTRKKPGTPAKRLDAKAAVDVTALIANADFVSDFARYSEGLMSDEFCTAFLSSWRGGDGRRSIAR